MNTVQETEFLWQWKEDRAEGQMPDEWFAHRILKRTKQFVFVEYRVGENHPYRRTMKLNRAELEAEGKTYWSHGTLVIGFYTEEGKKRFDLQKQSYIYVPECLKALGLTKDATTADVKQAYHEKALKQHPDTGGSHEGFLKLQEQYRTALRMVK
jgi:DnaJ-class molecular chaperone with C-terminal Zn finger domain